MKSEGDFASILQGDGDTWRDPTLAWRERRDYLQSESCVWVSVCECMSVHKCVSVHAWDCAHIRESMHIIESVSVCVASGMMKYYGKGRGCGENISSAQQDPLNNPLQGSLSQWGGGPGEKDLNTYISLKMNGGKTRQMAMMAMT